ncbi:MAG: cyclic nucleotide-binding domain-containing protein [Synechocystis sp.]|nr:cyclic nucleotide-binding domain-containing protein [Synechocystis sp.]
MSFQSAFDNIIKALNSVTFVLGQNQLSLLIIVQIGLYLLLIFILVHYLNRLLKGLVLKRLIEEKGVRYVVANLISYALGTFVFIIILQSTGVNLSALAVLGGALGFGIGLGLQYLTRNFVSGLTLLVEHKIKIGDYIQFQDVRGYVREVSARAVVVGLKDGSSVIVPSSVLMENQVINYHYENETVRLTIPVGVDYGTDPVLVTETLLLSAYTQTVVRQTPPAQVIFQGFGDSSLNFELWVWIDRDCIGQQPEILSALRYAIAFYFRRNHITIPFPQQDLWLKNPEAIGQYLQPDLVVSPTSAVNPDPLISLSRTLQANHYFQGLNELEIRQLIEIGQLQSLTTDQVLFHEQDQGDAFYIVITGSVQVYTEQLGKVLATLDSGSFFGELSLMLGIPRTASVKAIEKTLLFVIKRPQFEFLLKTNADFYEAIVAALSLHQEELAQRRAELAEKGLLGEGEEDSSIIRWVRKRLQTLFQLSS